MNDPTIDPSEIVFHSIRHTSAGVKLRLFSGDLKAVQGDGRWSPPDKVTKRHAHILDENRRMLASEMEQQFYQKGGTVIQPAATEKASAMDANALAVLLTGNPELLTKFFSLSSRLITDDLIGSHAGISKTPVSKESPKNRISGSINPASISRKNVSGR